jgi:ribonuclease E
VIADPTVSGQQSFVIDRGEQVHTLEAAKALLAAQVAAFPSQTEEAFDQDEPFEVEAEVETEETEGLTDDQPAGEESQGEVDADGHKRKRRRRRRGRSGEAREGGPVRDDNEIPRVASDMVAAPGAIADEGEPDDEEAEDQSGDQPGAVRADQAAGGERRPRRRGRRGGRRRRGGPEDGLAGSIADELGPTSISEATSAVADFDGVPPEPSLPVIQPESIAPAAEVQHADRGPQEAAPAFAQEETAQEAERAARRRSTVREKVSFLVDAQPAAATPVTQSHPEPHNQPEPAPAPAQPESETTSDTQPRRAGWWSRRFGNGE